MRIEQTNAKKGWKAGLVGAVAGLTLAAGTLLATGSTPTKHAASFVGAVKPAAAAVTTTTPGAANAERDTLDLQLD